MYCWLVSIYGFNIWTVSIYIYIYIYGSSMDNLWIIYGYGWWLSLPPLKNMSSSIGMIMPNIWKNQTWSKPPTIMYCTRNHGKSFHYMVVYCAKIIDHESKNHNKWRSVDVDNRENELRNWIRPLAGVEEANWDIILPGIEVSKKLEDTT